MMECPVCGKRKPEVQRYRKIGGHDYPIGCFECDERAKAAYRAVTPKDKRKKS
jgi:hypothetical protein